MKILKFETEIKELFCNLKARLCTVGSSAFVNFDIEIHKNLNPKQYENAAG
jgi:hypothetical protein